jgi:hypothetical protein
MSKFRYFRSSKIGTEHWAVCDASNSNTNFTKDINKENLTLNPESREEFYIELGKLFYHQLLVSTRYFVSKLIIALRFEVLLTTEISVIFHHISVGIETPNTGPLKLNMKMELIAK